MTDPKHGRFGVADRAIVNDASKAVAAVPASIPNAVYRVVLRTRLVERNGVFYDVRLPDDPPRLSIDLLTGPEDTP